jgi:arabinofuranosyltransferase
VGYTSFEFLGDRGPGWTVRDMPETVAEGSNLKPDPGRGRERLHGLMYLAAPLAVFITAAWSRRWVAEDGFINFRIVRFIQDGYGPVYNIGERVEAGTSPLWLGILTIGDWLLPISLEWVAVVLGITFSAVGLMLAARAGGRVAGSLGERDLVPIGLFVYCSVSVGWDFASGGLENGLGLMYLGGCSALLIRAAGSKRDTRNPLLAAWVIGLGPLIRPDFSLYAGVFLIALILLGSEGLGNRVRLVVASMIFPGAYQVFRMAFFGIIVPNTALTKSASGARWDRGMVYLQNLVLPYFLLPVIGLVVCLAIFQIIRPAFTLEGTRRYGLAWLALPGAGLLHALYVIRIGGDFMHGRMLLPALFSILVPVVVGRRNIKALLAVGAWMIIAVIGLRSSTLEFNIWGTDVYDERSFYVKNSGNENPVTVKDYTDMGLGWVTLGETLKQRADEGISVGFLKMKEVELGPERLRPGVEAKVYAAMGNVGIAGYVAGTDVHILDTLGLAHPLVARIEANRDGRPGHEKKSNRWVWAPLVPELSTPGMVKLLECPAVKELTAAITEPLTFDRMIKNLTGSIDRTRLMLPAEPGTDATCP